MNHNPYYFFSLIRNVSTFCEKEKDIDFDKKVNFLIFDRQKEHIKYFCNKIWNDYENGIFTIQEFKIYLLYNHLFKKKFFVTSICTKDVKEIFKLFNEEQFKRDYENIKSICKNINISNIKDFFDIKMEEDKTVAEDLMLRKIISPVIYVKYFEKIDIPKTRIKRIIQRIKKEKQECQEQ